jgi:acyl-CoA thioesterase-1
MRVLYCVMKKLPRRVAVLLFALLPSCSVASDRTIAALGDSLTVGYGLRPDQAYPALLQEKIRAAGLPHNVINAGVSGDTTAGGVGRIDWLLARRVDVLILALGANDGLRGVPVAETRKNLQAIIDKTLAAHPRARIVLAGMKVPPNMGQTYADQFAALFPELAATNGLILIPFLLEGVAGRPELNQDDGIHPNAAGQRIMADTVWRAILPLLQK